MLISTGIINVIKGPAAIRLSQLWWMGYASGHTPTGIKRRTAKRALKDAIKLEQNQKEQA